jgi:hypothetical protein
MQWDLLIDHPRIVEKVVELSAISPENLLEPPNRCRHTQLAHE